MRDKETASVATMRKGADWRPYLLPTYLWAGSDPQTLFFEGSFKKSNTGREGLDLQVPFLKRIYKQKWPL